MDAQPAARRATLSGICGQGGALNSVHTRKLVTLHPEHPTSWKPEPHSTPALPWGRLPPTALPEGQTNSGSCQLSGTCWGGGDSPRLAGRSECDVSLSEGLSASVVLVRGALAGGGGELLTREHLRKLPAQLGGRYGNPRLAVQGKNSSRSAPPCREGPLRGM